MNKTVKDEEYREDINLKCECGYDFQDDKSIQWWEKIGETICCPKCGCEYEIDYDAYGEGEYGCCDHWSLQKITG